MVKIYLNISTLEVIVEGLTPMHPSNAILSIANGRVSIYDKAKQKTVFEDKWQNITDGDGNTLSTETEMQTYLSNVFTPISWRDLYGDPEFDINNDLLTRLTF